MLRCVARGQGNQCSFSVGVPPPLLLTHQRRAAGAAAGAGGGHHPAGRPAGADWIRRRPARAALGWADAQLRACSRATYPSPACPVCMPQQARGPARPAPYTLPAAPPAPITHPRRARAVQRVRHLPGKSALPLRRLRLRSLPAVHEVRASTLRTLCGATMQALGSGADGETLSHAWEMRHVPSSASTAPPAAWTAQGPAGRGPGARGQVPRLQGSHGRPALPR